MTLTAYSTAIVNGMLGWLKGLANWVLRLFNLAGSGGTSPLLWLSTHWFGLLIALLIVGVAGDMLVWLFRWRPHWVWFRRERVIVDDERFFSDADIREQLEAEDLHPRRDWYERDYVVSSTLARRAKPSYRRPPKNRNVRRRHLNDRVQPGPRRRKPDAAAQPTADTAAAPVEQDMFGQNVQRPGVTDVYEDEVFNVSSLPTATEVPAEEQKTDAEE